MLQRLSRFVGNLHSGRALLGYGRRIGMAKRYIFHFVKAVRVAAAPVEYLRRRLLARHLARRSTPRISVPRDRGFAFIEAEDIAESRAALDCARHIAEARKVDYLARVVGTPSQIHLLEPQDFARYPQLLALALSSTLVEAAACYLGTIPVLTQMQLWLSPPNATLIGSQLFHRDKEDFRQLKVFMYVSDVDEASGPLTLFPARESRAACEKMGHPISRVEDDALFACLDQKNAVSCTGSAGCGAAVDTSQCFHYGSRGNHKERIILMMQYLTYHEVIEPAPFLPLEMRSDNGLLGLQALAFPRKRHYFVDGPGHGPMHTAAEA